MWKNKEKTNFYEKYKPESWVYIAIMVIFAVIRFVPFSSGSLNFDEALNDLAVGCVASAEVAWLIEIAACRKKNKERIEKECMVFSEYIGSIKELCYFISRRTINIAPTADKRSFKQWLFILSDLSGYKSEVAFESRKRSYQHIVVKIKRIKDIFNTLKNQYALLVQADIIDTDDFRQHMYLQIALCDDICDNLEINDFSDVGINIANDLLDELVSNTDAFFPNNISKVYSWADVKG